MKRGEYGNRKWSKINRILVNIEWLDIMQECVVNFLPAGVSCHTLTVIEWSVGSKKIYLFKFNNGWNLIKGIREKIETKWEPTLVGDPMFTLTFKLKKLKLVLKKWVKENGPNLQTDIARTRNKLSKIQEALNGDTENEVLINEKEALFDY